MTNIITGSTGFLGTHLMRLLRAADFDPYGATHQAYDLRSQTAINSLFKHTGKPDIIFHLAAHVGGIQYNIEHPAELFYDNLIMNTQLIHKAAEVGSKIIMCGTVCSYPAYNPTPTREHRLWEGYPEASNGPYGIAKLVALEQLQTYQKQYGLRFVYPVLSNLYGPGGKAEATKSHVIPALIRRFIDNPEQVTIWGDGSPTRDFLYVEDAARALMACMKVDYNEPINIASGVEISIKVLVEMIAGLLDYKGEIKWDASRPNGQARRGYDIYRARHILDWKPTTPFGDGLRETVTWYKQL